MNVDLTYVFFFFLFFSLFKNSFFMKKKKKKLNRRSSFAARDIELTKPKQNKRGTTGQLRTLYADGEEFVGLTTEVHSIHGSLDQVKAMCAMLMQTLEKTSSAAADKVKEDAKFQEVDTSEEEVVEEEVEEVVVEEVEEKKKVPKVSASPSAIKISMI